MHILFLTENFPPEVNATAGRVYERACYWVKWGHKVTIITTAPNFPEGKVYSGYKNKCYQVEDMDGIRIVRVKTFIAKNAGFLLRTLDFLSFMFAGAIAGLLQKNIDIVVATSPQFFVGLAGLTIAKLKRKTFMLELADLWPASIIAVGVMKRSSAIKLLEKLELYLYKKSNNIVTLTEAFKRNLTSRGISSEKIVVVRNGAELSHFKQTKKPFELLHALQLTNKFVIGYIGTLGMAHGLANILEVAERLKNNEKIHFLFVGTGADKENLMSIKQSKQLHNVTFVDKQPKSQIPQYWALCNLALVHLKNHPVFSEVIPSKIFEAMAMQVPILLVSPAGAAKEIIEGYNVGFWVQSGNNTHIIKQLIELSGSPEKLEVYQQACTQSAPECSRETQAAKMLEVIVGS